jgi:hypothetical protein
MDRWVRELGERIGRELGQVIAEGMRRTLARSVDTKGLVSNGKRGRGRASAAKSTCIASGCSNPVLAKGLCRSHYYRERYQAQKAERRKA